MQAGLTRDVWLSDVLGFDAFVTDRAGTVPTGTGRSLTYAKLDVSETEDVGRLTRGGFSVVDVNVVLVRKNGPRANDPASVGPAEPDEGERLIEIAGRCFTRSRFHLDPLLPNELADRIKREWIRSHVEGGRGRELLAVRSGDEPVGFLAVLDAGDARVIDLVGVAPEHQGRGHGRELVECFVARHSAPGRELRVGTQIANVESLRLYERLGFTVARAAYVLHLHRGLE